MSILSQFISAVTGKGTEQQTNDTDDGPLHSPNALPPNPFSRSSPTLSGPSAASAIDLNSPTRPSRTSDQPPTQAKTDRSRLLKHTRSADEKRLTGDFNVPADFVAAPDPSSYFQGSMVKPGSNNSFQPINTLSNGSASAKPRRYGRASGRTAPSIGRAIGDGQLAYLEQWSSPRTPSETPTPRSGRTSRPAVPSPAKRRKTGHASPQLIIDLSEDNDVEEISSSRALKTPTVHQHGLPRSAHSTRSQFSIGSNRTVDGIPSGSQPANEFQNIENQIKSARPKVKKQQTPSSLHGASFGRSRSGSPTPGPQKNSTRLLNYEPEMSNKFTRKAIFDGFEQGVIDNTTSERGLSSQKDAPVFHHFPNARINESNNEIDVQRASERESDGNLNHLRTFRRHAEPVEKDPISDDELGLDIPRHEQTVVKKHRSGSNTGQTANSGAKRTTKAAKAARGWPLISARSLNFDSFHLSRSKEKEHFLHLKSTDDQRLWRIVAYDDASGSFQTQETITPRDVVKVWADDDGRIRLEGSRTQDGNQHIIDMEFMDTTDFREFRDIHAVALSGRDNPSLKEAHHMKLVFSRPLRRNDKVGTLPPVSDAPLLANDEHPIEARPKARALWEQMKPEALTRNGHATVSRETAPSAPKASMLRSVRTARSTRASAPIHDAVVEGEADQIERYSEIVGLGKAWRDPLNFGEGRQRATVNFNDLLRLDEGEFLNDNLIDFYMIYCFKQSNIPKNKIFFFNTFFYSKLTEKTGRASINYKAVERWAPKGPNDIFTYDYIVVPINEDTHWYLAIICNVGNIARKAIQEDFDDGAPQDPATSIDATTDQEVLAATEIPEESKAFDTVNGPASSRAPSAEQVDHDVNLFDEKSELDLVDREDAGFKEEMRPTPAHPLPVPHPPGIETADKLPSIFDQAEVPRTVLSNLNHSPKKKLKRRSTAPKKDPNAPIIIIMDSLSQTRSSAVRALKDWVAAEGDSKRGMEAVIREKGYYPKADQIPTQSNFSDCGVYLLGYAEKFFQDPDAFKTKLLQGEMTADEDWPQLKPKEMRNSLREIIIALAKEQKLTEPKKKKGKRPINAKTAPPQLSTEPTKVGNLSSLPREPAISRSIEMSELSTETVAESPSQMASAGSPPPRPRVPRLGSPFKPELQVERSSSHSGVSATLDKPLTSASVSPTKVGTTSPRPKHISGTRIRPEVWIPGQSPALQIARHEAQPAVAQTDGQARQASPASESVSPLKRTRSVEEDDELLTPRKKTVVKDFRLAERKEVSPLPVRLEHGHSDHPIEILDSQEFWPRASQSPQRNHRGPVAQWKQPSRSPRMTRALHPTPSIEKISSFPVETVQRAQHPAMQALVDHKLVAKLDADDKQRQKSKHSRSGSRESPLELDRAEEDFEPQLMDVDFQGYEDEAMGTTSHVISETPTPERSSPPAKSTWVEGKSLQL